MPKLNRKSTPERCLPARLEAAASAANRARHISPFRWKRKALIPVCLLILTFAVGLTLSLPITKDTLISKVKAQSISAFPGAEGFGANTPGGRGGKVMEVTNTNDSGPGSLRACVEASGPRTCVFRTGGTINGSFSINNPYITIAGQTAPGGGITIRTANGGDAFTIKTHDVVIRYIAARPGPGGENHAIEIAYNNVTLYNIVIDHCSLSWGTDEVFETWYANHDVTCQWSIISEGLDCSTHPKGCHSKGALLGSYSGSESQATPGAKDISFHHNLLAHNAERGPLVKTAGLTDVVNNVIYDSRWEFSHVDMESQQTKVLANYVGNYFKPGPSTDGDQGEISTTNAGSYGAGIYVKGNIGPHRTSDTMAENLVVESGSRGYVVTNHFPAEPITTTSAFTAYDQVLANAGATTGLDSQGNSFSRRDAIDQRIVNDVKNGTGRIIDDPSDVGGWLTIASGTPYADSDHDGMADEWENMYGFNPNSSSDGPQDADGDGYTNLEEFLNGTDPTGGAPLPSPTLSPTPTPSPSPTPSVHCPPLGDIDCSGKVNGLDFGYLVIHWGSSNPEANLDDRGMVDALDALILLGNYGQQIP